MQHRTTRIVFNLPLAIEARNKTIYLGSIEIHLCYNFSTLICIANTSIGYEFDGAE